jgi:purine-nucleoside phosphorylase
LTTPFENLFGILPGSVEKNVLLFPLIPKGFLKVLGLEKLNRGRLYASGNIPGITVIQTGMGAPFVGDAVLYLKETNCKNVFLLGSCGALYSNDSLKLAACVLPDKCLAFESFSQFLLEEGNTRRIFHPNLELMEDFLKFAGREYVGTAMCATVSSLKLEEDRHDWLLNQGIEIVDMECSAFFSAASHVGLSALACFYVTDIVKVKPFYEGSFIPAPEKMLKCIMDFVRQKQS